MQYWITGDLADAWISGECFCTSWGEVVEKLEYIDARRSRGPLSDVADIMAGKGCAA
jgi:hypothetical protein